MTADEARRIFSKSLTAHVWPMLRAQGFQRTGNSFTRINDERAVTERLVMSFHGRPMPSIELSGTLTWPTLAFVLCSYFGDKPISHGPHLVASLGDMMGTGWTEIQIRPTDTVERLGEDLRTTWSSIVLPWLIHHNDLPNALAEWESLGRPARYNAQWYGPAAALVVGGRAKAIKLAEAYRSLARSGELNWEPREFDEYDAFLSFLREADVAL